MEKECSCCGRTLKCNKTNFQPRKKGKFGFDSKCKECTKEYQRKRRLLPEVKERHRLSMIEWRKNNPEKTRQINKKCRDKHKDRINKNRRERYKNDPEYKKKRIEYDKKYKESGRRAEINKKPENMESARKRSRKRRKDPIKKAHDYKRQAEWRKNNKEYLDKLHAKNRNELSNSYVAQTLGISVKEAPEELIETKRIIIKLKRELKANNVKIR